MVKQKDSSSGQGEPVKKALRPILPRLLALPNGSTSHPQPQPEPQAINTHSSAPAPIARSRIATQDLSCIQIKVALLAPDGSDQEWFVADGKVPAFVAEVNNNSAPSQQESSTLCTDGSSHPVTDLGTTTPTCQGLGFELDVSALRQAHENYGSMPLGYINASAILKIGKYPVEVATCKAALIQRGSERYSFWHRMAETSPHAFRLAFDLLDAHGFLLPEYHQNTYHRGSGCWGPELGHGHILLFEEISVGERLQGHGIGKKIVAAVLEKARKALVNMPPPPVEYQEPASHAPFYAFAKPDASGGLGAVLDAPGTAPTPENQNVPALEGFWRSSGFTRVGSSPWFAYGGSPSHSQQSTATTPDWSPPEPQQQQTPRPEVVEKYFSDLFSPMGPENRSPPGLDRLIMLAYGGGAPIITKWVLHGGAAPVALTTDSFSVPSGMRLLEERPMSGFAAARNQHGLTPRQALRDNPAWFWKDGNGNNVLHIAALTERPEMVHDIMAVMPELAVARNHQGLTPLEALQRQLHLVRIWPYVERGVGLVPGRFVGFTPSAIQCIARLSSPTTYRDLTPIQVLRLKYGCTCGACDGGFLSPRMRAVLKLHAKDFSTYAGQEWMEDYYGNKEAPIVCLMWLRVAEVISTCLEDDEKIPDMATVRAEWASDGGDRYGDIESHIRHVADKMIRNASEFTPSPSAAPGGEVPGCRNDYEFALVRDVCGYFCVPEV